ncbi:MAG: hypothetical protein JST84_04750 [Acidobacteria bacterium]|nr:hypothetical protein [Acidobacteriota bacterium]
MTATSPTFETLTEITSKVPLLGYGIFWRATGIRVTEDLLLQKLKEHDFEDFAPTPPSHYLTTRRAIEAWIRDKRLLEEQIAPIAEDEDESDETRIRRLIRIVQRPGTDKVVFALVNEGLDYSAYGLKYATNLRILLDKKTGQIMVSSAAAGAITQSENLTIEMELNDRIREFKNLFFASDLIAMVTRMIQAMKGVSLKKSGGYYFVPEAESENVLAMQSMMNSLPCFDGGEATFAAIGIFDAGRTKTDMVKAISGGLMDEIRALEKDLGRLGETEKTRSKTVAERLAWYKQIREKAQLYHQYLGLNQAKIEAAVHEMEQAAKALLMREVTSATNEDQASLF